MGDIFIVQLGLCAVSGLLEKRSVIIKNKKIPKKTFLTLPSYTTPQSFCNPCSLYGRIVIMNTQMHFDKEKIAKIAQKYMLLFVILFGSKARGERANAESDLDIGVLSLHEPDYGLFKNVVSDLSDIFKGQNADVRFLNGTDLLFRFQVVKDGILIFGKEKNYSVYKLSIMRQYQDDGEKYFPMLDRMIEVKQNLLEEHL